MLSKIRSTAVVFVAVSSFIATSALPAAQAKPINPHRNVTTKYAVNKKVVSGPCHELMEMLNESLRELDRAHKEGDDEQVKPSANRPTTSTKRVTKTAAASRRSGTARERRRCV